MTRPLVSIVTPVLNRVDQIGAALDSVCRAGAVPTEHLVVDGGSTDGTVSLVRSRPGIRLIEAPGTGIYDALNLGLRAACGDIICQLNSDDLLPAGALEAVAEADAGAGREADAVRGHALFFADDAAQNASAATLTAEFPVPLRPRDIALGLPAINALFVRRRLYDCVGYFDPRFRLAADREWLLRAFAAGIRVHQIGACVYCFRLHAGSLTIDPGRSGSVAIRLEHLEISRRVFGSPDTPAELRRLCRRWYAKEAALLLYLAAGGRYEPGVSRVLRDTLAVSPQWPVALPRELLAFAGRRLRRWLRPSPWRLEATSR
ncbi:MAG TPA: glycosyltransferase [Stellaceae bacterium]|nr:glycosyltransferase [Stellaceae bacterium]